MKKKSENFNPDDIAVFSENFFGLPYSVEESDVILLSAPWDATTSYRAGTSRGPKSLLDASLQVDLFDEDIAEAWRSKIGTDIPDDDVISRCNDEARPLAEGVILKLGEGFEQEELKGEIDRVNELSHVVNSSLYERAKGYLDQNKIVGVVGGDHSVPYGLLKALGEKYDDFGLLHIDAHADLRCAYEGFIYSHASIMFNVLKNIPSVKSLSQVGLRDFSGGEKLLMDIDGRIKYFTDRKIAKRLFEGDKWSDICDDIIDSLPQRIYISFDIDGLASDLSPNTGTPVPGGLTFREVDYLFMKIMDSGRKLIGFDLCEVSSGEENELDAIVGARILFRLALMADRMR